MQKPPDFAELSCQQCAKACDLGFEFSMAFQPIIDWSHKRVFAYEALARGPEGQGAGWVFSQVNDDNRYRFDQSCRVKAIQLAAELGIDAYLSINFMPNAVYRPELCIRTTLAAAEEYGFNKKRIIFEFTENEQIIDKQHLRNIVKHYLEQGFLTAIDDFGAGYNGLELLTHLSTNFVKLDMNLIRNIDQDKKRQIIVRQSVRMLQELDMLVIAEAIETAEERDMLLQLGVTLFQGYYFAKPTFEGLPEINWS